MKIYRVLLGGQCEFLVSDSGFSAGDFRQHCLAALMAGRDTVLSVSDYLIQNYDYGRPEFVTVNLENCTYSGD